MKDKIKALIYRIILAITISLCLKYIGMEPDRETNSTLFTVVGVFYSIVMSIYVSISMDNIKNEDYRENLKKFISDGINFSSIDFAICTLLYMIQYDNVKYIQTAYFTLSVIYMWIKLRKVHQQQQYIADQIFEEEQARIKKEEDKIWKS